MLPMLLFWVLAAALLAGVLAALLVPLLSTRRSRGIGDADRAAIAVLRDQKRALEAEHASGAISGSERELALADLARRAGEEVAPT
ncbi:MAG TPA: c-type cytochrome biogenesis protein CcmI, partial [Burkholderiales bacterium]|nr:c-type cytochrome biogenesis protein CcmI [Burkholderiales bacterium]